MIAYFTRTTVGDARELTGFGYRTVGESVEIDDCRFATRRGAREHAERLVLAGARHDVKVWTIEEHNHVKGTGVVEVSIVTTFHRRRSGQVRYTRTRITRKVI